MILLSLVKNGASYMNNSPPKLSHHIATFLLKKQKQKSTTPKISLFSQM